MNLDKIVAVALVALLVLMAGPPVRAVTIIGTPGVNGQPGQAGSPGSGTDGTDGTDGGDADASEVVATGSASSTAEGGIGGNGGAGGPGTLDGGNGGDGGDGGHATAVAETQDGSSAIASADAGEGGSGGDGGNGSAGVDGSPGVKGRGGDASAVATAADTGSGAVAAEATAAGGGVTGNPTPPNEIDFGSATATASAQADGNAVASSTSSGGPGSEMLSSHATATSAAGDAFATSRVSASGDFLPSDQAGLDVGDVSASAFASNEGDGTVRSSAEATLRVTTSPGKPIGVGAVSVGAEGISTGGGDVDVIAALVSTLYDIDLELNDAVHGSTAGQLTLIQELFGVGDVAGSLVASNEGGGDLDIHLGLASRAPTETGSGFHVGFGDAILGDVIGTSDDGSDVAVTVDAVAGSGLLKGSFPSGFFLEDAHSVIQQSLDDDGNPVPSSIYGESNGGSVEVSVRFEAGFGASVPASIANLDGGDGASTEMVNVSSGSTTGDLALAQEAVGGGGGTSNSLAGGDGGDALSELRKDTDSRSLQLESTSIGGNGAAGGGGPAGTGGSATSIAEAFNSEGSVEVQTLARGGASTFGTIAGVRAGDASADAFARTSGDGHDVTIGNRFALPNALQGAVAGSGSILTSGPFHGSSGGDADSRSVGIAEGNAVVDVFDTARGGSGGGGRGALTQTGGHGGAASSLASASGGGDRDVLGTARAFGGFGGGNLGVAGNGGNAVATANAVGLGFAEARATSLGGSAGIGRTTPGRAGSGVSLATASGQSGLALADATTGSNGGVKLHASTLASVGSNVLSTTRAEATHGASLTHLPTGEHGAKSMLTGAPNGADVAAALGADSQLANLFSDDPGASMVAMGEWSALHDGSGGESLVVSTVLDITLAVADPTRQLMLSVFEVSAVGDGFEQMSLRIEGFGNVVEQATFTTLAEALGFLETTIFDAGLATIQGTAPVARAFFDVTLGAGDGITMGIGFAVAVPEPGTGLLLVMGLVVLAGRRRARR